MTYRHELKFLIHQSDYHVLRIRVAGLLEKDIHTGKRGYYTVRSLYFDDYCNSAFNDKDISILERQKYRIRIYNHSSDVIHLERKIKYNNYIHKQISPLSLDDVDKITREEYDGLKHSPQHLQNIFYHEIISRHLRPRLVIDYEREPYIYKAGNVRINFDMNVRAGLEKMDIFCAEMAMAETLETGFLIMEVKYIEFLPRMIRELLPTQDVDCSAVSKYLLGCRATLNNRQTDY